MLFGLLNGQCFIQNERGKDLLLTLRRKKKRRRDNELYSIADFFFDLLFWIPELLFLPFRLLFYGARGIIRWIDAF